MRRRDESPEYPAAACVPARRRQAQYLLWRGRVRPSTASHAIAMLLRLVVIGLLIGPPGSGASHASVLAGQTRPPTSGIDALVAPIALYPDQLLAQILLCAGNPTKVGALDEWLKVNRKLKGTALQDAAVKAGFDASFVALVLFPQVITQMAEDLDWTTKLGQAFSGNRSAVFDSIQRLRKQAKDVGTLKTTPQQDVKTQTTSSGQNVIVIEPSNPQVVYVPQYNTQTVYTQAPTTTTVVIQEDDDDTAEAVAAGLIGFTAGIAIGAAFDNNYYYGPYGWHGGGYMYNDAWDDYYDAREDAREDWQDHREDLMEDRGERAEDAREQRGERAETAQQSRTDRPQNRQENRPESQTARTGERSGERAAAGQTASSTSSGARGARSGSYEARGYGDGQGGQATRQRSGGSDAFSGYSSGRSERASSARGQRSRGSRGGGGGGRRR